MFQDSKKQETINKIQNKQSSYGFNKNLKKELIISKNLLAQNIENALR